MLKRLVRLSKHSGFRHYFGHSSWMLGEQCLRIVAGLLVGVWVARHLEPSQFGVYSYVLALLSIFSGFSKLGLDNIIVKRIAIDSSNYLVYLGTAFWLKVVGSALLVACVFLSISFNLFNSEIEIFVIIVAIAVLFQSFEVVDFFYQAKLLGRIISLCKTTQLIASSTIKVYLILAELPLIYFVLVCVIDTVILATCYFLSFLALEKKSFLYSFKLSESKNLIKTSWPLLLSTVVYYIYVRIDQVMLQAIQGDSAVGIYSASVTLCQATYFLPNVIVISLFPAILASAKLSKEVYRNRISSLYSLVIYLGIGIWLCTLILSDYLILTLFGENYEGSSDILEIHTFASIFAFTGIVYGKHLITYNLERMDFYKNLLGMLVNITLNTILIPRYSGVGAAYATLFSYIFANFLFDLIVPDLRAHFIIKVKAFSPFYLFSKLQ